jgi:hypothetical protein
MRAFFSPSSVRAEPVEALHFFVQEEKESPSTGSGRTGVDRLVSVRDKFNFHVTFHVLVEFREIIRHVRRFRG